MKNKIGIVVGMTMIGLAAVVLSNADLLPKSIQGSLTAEQGGMTYAECEAKTQEARNACEATNDAEEKACQKEKEERDKNCEEGDSDCLKRSENEWSDCYKKAFSKEMDCKAKARSDEMLCKKLVDAADPTIEVPVTKSPDSPYIRCLDEKANGLAGCESALKFDTETCDKAHERCLAEASNVHDEAICNVEAQTCYKRATLNNLKCGTSVSKTFTDCLKKIQGNASSEDVPEVPSAE